MKYLLFILLIVVCTAMPTSLEEVIGCRSCAEDNLALLNAHRVANGLNKLYLDAAAYRAAVRWSMSMITTDNFDHSDSTYYLDYENIAYR